MNIKDQRADMLERQQKDNFISLDVGYDNKHPNQYRILQEVFFEALRPLNKKNDQLLSKGWHGVIRSQPLRSWLQVTPPCIIEVDVYEDKIMLLADNTIATFKFTPVGLDQTKEILAFLPFDYS